MNIQKKLADALRIFQADRGKSITEFSAELEISRSALEDYLSGSGNPSMSTVEHIADKLGVSPSLLLFGSFSEDQLHILLRLTDILSFLSDLPPDRRLRFAELLLEMVSLWNGVDCDAAD